MTERRPIVALVTDAIGPYHHGGKELRYLELANRLSARADVHVYTMKWWEGPSTWSDGAVTYHALSPLLPLYSGGRRSIRQAIVFAIACLRLMVEKFDVIEADHMPYMQLFTLKAVALVRRRRLVVTWHEYWGRDYWTSYMGRAGRLGWICESLATRLPDMIIAASPETAKRLRDVTRNRVEVVVAPNGINLDLIGEVKADTERVDVVVVGRLLPHKRIDLLLEALAILREQSRTVTAQVVGNGPQLEELVTLARELGVIDCVDFRQDVDSDRDLFGVLKAARVAVFPSEREGFGIAVLEALACGIPVITTSAPDNLARHLVDRSLGGGLVCEPSAEAIAAAILAVLDHSGAPAMLDSSWLLEYDWGTITDRVAAALW